MLVTHLSGERHFELGTGIPYESGVPITGSARLRLSADFYLVAMFFVIFDISAVYLFAWAVCGARAGLARLRGRASYSWWKRRPASPTCGARAPSTGAPGGSGSTGKGMG